ncbi:MAG: copper homeostasis protein CutC [Anaerolineae bacterium]|nr:copper homeostasis protein CutC [Anaerolineae bacterium]
MPKLEIASTSLQDALHAQEGGADSIEISHNLAAGGLTPSLELIEAIRAALHIDIYVIVRPHDRDFVYTSEEIDQILMDTRAIAHTGIQGIVFGAQRPDGHLDIDLIRRVVDAANGLPVTLHRAIDSSREPEKALEALIGVVPRVLTSGPAATAWEGRDGLRQWVRDYSQYFRFVASGGLKMAHLRDYAAQVGAHEYHFGSAARSGKTVDVELVRQLRAIVTA